MNPTAEGATSQSGYTDSGGVNQAGRRRVRKAMRHAGDANSGGGNVAAEGRTLRSMPTAESARRRQATKRRGQRDR